MQFLAHDLNECECGALRQMRKLHRLLRLGGAYPERACGGSCGLLGTATRSRSIPGNSGRQAGHLKENEGELPLRARRAKEGRSAKWGDAGFGDLVRRGKHDGNFPDRLVESRRRSRARPLESAAGARNGVTCVPSRRHPSVGTLTSRVA